MPRTNATDVKEIFDTELTDPEVEAWIDVATELVDEIAEEDSSIDSTRLTLIEKLLAAHLTAAKDPRTERERVADVTLTYQGDTGLLIYGTQYGQRAAMLDPTGLLAQQGKPQADFEAI